MTTLEHQERIRQDYYAKLARQKMIKEFIENIKNFVIGGCIFIGGYIALNYIIYAIEKYIN